LDYAQARYFSSTQGRFTSADPLLASATAADPQSWNRYAYVGNNPMVFSDPSGLSRGPAGLYSSIHDADRAPQSRGNNTLLEEAQAEWEVRLADTLEAIREAEWLNELAKTDPEGAAAIAALNPMISSHPEAAPEVVWDRAQLMSEDDVLREAEFQGVANQAELNVEHSRVGNVNRGDPFTMKVLFNLPKYARPESIKEESFVKIVKNNRWEFYYSPTGARAVEFSATDRSGSVTVRLKQGDAEGLNNRLIISVSGFYGSGDKFSGQASLTLVTKADSRRQPVLKIP
jgi:hypothetical protein